MLPRPSPTTPALAPATIFTPLKCSHNLQTPASPGSRLSSDHSPLSTLLSRSSSNCWFGHFSPSLQDPTAPRLASGSGALLLPITLAAALHAPGVRLLHTPHPSGPTSLLLLLPSAWHALPPMPPSLTSNQTWQLSPLCSHSLQEVSSDLTPNDSLFSAVVETGGWGGWWWEVGRAPLGQLIGQSDRGDQSPRGKL